jgi:Fe-S-cluster-containing hydrogenase component 2
MAKRLVIDLAKCDGCKDCTVNCAYLYQPGLHDHGLTSIREYLAYAVVCRRCENASCINACKFSALERQPDGLLKRYNMRCVSCKCCSHACPFGTIYPELIPFYAVRCDNCASKIETGDISCASSCAKSAIEFKEVEENPKENLFIVNDFLATRGVPRWVKDAV